MRRFFSQAWLFLKGQNAAFSFEEFVLFKAGYPIVTLVFYCLLASYSFSKTDLTRWVVGNSFLLCMNTTLFGLGNTFAGERFFGRIRSIVVAPSSKLALVLQHGFFPSVIAFAMVFFGFMVGSLLFSVDFSRIDMGLFAVTAFVAMFAASGLGVFLSVFGLISDSMHFVLNVMSYVLMIFCGANFPLSQLPATGQFVAKLLPLTRTIEAANLLFEGFQAQRFLALLLGEALLGAAYYIAAACIVKAVERIARKRASFEVF
jgi:ABC-2 type transport system permease protein